MSLRGRPRKKKRRTNASLNLRLDLLEELDRRKREQQKRSEKKVSRSDVANLLLGRAIEDDREND